MKNSVIAIQINEQTVLSADAKQFIDYLSDSIVKKNSKSIAKRNIILQLVDVLYKLGVVVVVVKYFPELLAIFIR